MVVCSDQISGGQTFQKAATNFFFAKPKAKGVLKETYASHCRRLLSLPNTTATLDKQRENLPRQAPFLLLDID